MLFGVIFFAMLASIIITAPVWTVVTFASMLARRHLGLANLHPAAFSLYQQSL